MIGVWVRSATTGQWVIAPANAVALAEWICESSSTPDASNSSEEVIWKTTDGL